MFHRMVGGGLRVMAAAVLVLGLLAGTGCTDAVMRDILNPDFIAAQGMGSGTLPDPQSTIAIVMVNETGNPAEIDLTITPQTGLIEAWEIGLGVDSFTPFIFECGITEIVITGGTVYTPDGPEDAEFEGGPLTENVVYTCGAVMKFYIHPWVTDTGDLVWRISSETTLD